MSAEDHLPANTDWDDTECIHGMWPVSSCTICSGADRRRAVEDSREKEYRTFPAKYPGQCPECNLPIVAGQVIAWREGAKPVHAECRWKQLTI